jgi:hypothetical protein
MTCQFCAPLDGLVQPTSQPAQAVVEIVVRLSADTPLINWGVAMDKLTEALGGGDWCYRMPPGKLGRYEVEVRS